MRILSTHDKGEYAEGMEWEVLEGVEIPNFGIGCAHAVPCTISGVAGVRVPRVLRAYNEGGFNHTMLCADCVLEALR